MAEALWVCLEYCKSNLLTGFPWENLSYPQYLNCHIIQFADVLGVFSLSFLIVMINVALFDLIAKRSKKTVISAVAFLILVGIFIYGAIRLSQVEKAMDNTKSMEIALIQINIDESIKWNTNFQKETLNKYERLFLQNTPAKKKGGGIVGLSGNGSPN